MVVRRSMGRRAIAADPREAFGSPAGRMMSDLLRPAEICAPLSSIISDLRPHTDHTTSRCACRVAPPPPPAARRTAAAKLCFGPTPPRKSGLRHLFQIKRNVRNRDGSTSIGGFSEQFELARTCPAMGPSCFFREPAQLVFPCGHPPARPVARLVWSGRKADRIDVLPRCALIGWPKRTVRRQ